MPRDGALTLSDVRVPALRPVCELQFLLLSLHGVDRGILRWALAGGGRARPRLALVVAMELARA
jgi:hypothetical protein